MNVIRFDPELVASCGLYCGACRSYLAGKCPGCQGNAKASWCKIRLCCRQGQKTTCAQCVEFSDPNLCKKYNNLVSKVFGFLLRSDRAACIAQIKQIGLDGHARVMAEMKTQTIKR